MSCMHGNTQGTVYCVSLSVYYCHAVITQIINGMIELRINTSPAHFWCFTHLALWCIDVHEMQQVTFCWKPWHNSTFCEVICTNLQMMILKHVIIGAFSEIATEYYILKCSLTHKVIAKYHQMTLMKLYNTKCFMATSFAVQSWKICFWCIALCLFSVNTGQKLC